MSKELYVSSTPHETKVAVVEEDQLAEVYFERENEYTLAGSIYKGRVTRVLPGMQSAFVDIGLERDAFLYVSDFFEQAEEEEAIESLPGGNGQPWQQEPEAMRSEGGAEAAAGPADAEPDAGAQAESAARPQPAQPGSESVPAGAAEAREERGRFGRRRRGRRGRGFPDSKYDRRPQPPAARPAPERSPAAAYQPIILPGESISKYRNRPAPASVPVSEAAAPSEVHAPALSPEEREEQPSSAAGGEFEHQTFPEAPIAAAAEPRRPTEEIDVPSVLRAHQESVQPRAERAPTEAARAGVVEEEEIGEEEAESPLVVAEEDDAEYEDFEEEMLDRLDDLERRESGAAALASFEPEPHAGMQQRAAATPAAAEEYPAEAESALVPEDAAAGFAAREMEAEEAAYPADTQAEDEAGAEAPAAMPAQAQMRGPSGYQQRVAFERGRRGRRTGRRSPVRGRGFRRGPLPRISDLLKEGQEVLVQIAKEPIGKKGARITSHIALPGRFLVYMPTVNHNGVSRKIASEEERLRLKRIIHSERQSAGTEQGGFIVRTAASSAGEDDLRADIRFLLNLWREIKQRAESSPPPALIYHDLNLVERVLRDQVSEGFSHIWADTEQEYERVLGFISRFQPSLTKRVKLYTKEVPLFEQFGIQEEINKSLKSKVWLKSGGYIVINQTEALVAIDVNTGKYVGKTQKLEDTIVKTNVDAIKEIVRQIRLRDLGGIIVIDFIDMDERRNRQKVMQALDEALKNDRAPSKVLQFNDFGLVAITRKRVRQSLERTLGSPCTYCTGTGLIKSVATVCNEIYVEMRKMSRHLEHGDVIVRVNPEVAKALKTNNARWLQDMEDLTGKTVLVKSDPALHQEQFDIH